MGLTKEEKIDAAVAVIQENAQAALDRGPDEVGRGSEYTEAYVVATVLEERGVLVREDAVGFAGKDRSDKRLHGQARRLLDEEARKPDARILRFSSHDGDPLPRLNGNRRGFYGAAVGYTTPELYAAAVAAVDARDARDKAELDEMSAMLDVAAAAGFPKPSAATARSVTYDADGLRALLERLTP
jgi:hypothetical protein